MKQIKRILGVLLIFCLLMAFVGCGKTNSPKLTPEEMVIAVMKNMQEVKSFDSNVDMIMDMEIMGERNATTTKMTMSSFTNEKTKMDMDLLVADQSIKMQIYVEQQGDSFTIYSNTMGIWSKQEVNLADYEAMMGQYDAQGSLDLYLKSAKNFKSMGTETINNVVTEKIQGILSGEDLSKVITEAGIMNSVMQQTGGAVDQSVLDAMLRDLGDLPLTIWVDADSLFAVRFEFDMTAMMQAMFTSLLGAMDIEEGAFVIHEYSMVMDYNNINNATPFTIPPEAKQ